MTIPKFRSWEKKARATFYGSTEVYRHLPKGMLTNLYHKMSTRNKASNFGELPFTLEEFQKWGLSDFKFNQLFNAWVESDYDHNLKPTVDRTNPRKGYSFSNMSWMFWEDNKKKGYLEVANKKHKPIAMFKDGVLVGKFKSIKDAQFFLGMKSNGNISECLSGRRNVVKGYNFKYIHENPELVEVENE